MTEANPAEYRRHRNSGTILIAIAGFLLVLVILLLTLSVYQGTIILAILALIVGNYAFNHFEKAVVFRPIAPIIHELELFSSALKNGSGVNVLLEIHYPSEQDSPLTLDRLKTRLQRTLNVHLSRIEALSADPYAEIDSLLQKEIEPLRQELGLGKIVLQTIDVKTSGVSSPPAKGIHFGRS